MVKKQVQDVSGANKAWLLYPPVVDGCAHKIVCQLHISQLAQSSAADHDDMLQPIEDACGEAETGWILLHIIFTPPLQEPQKVWCYAAWQQTPTAVKRMTLKLGNSAAVFCILLCWMRLTALTPAHRRSLIPLSPCSAEYTAEQHIVFDCLHHCCNLTHFDTPQQLVKFLDCVAHVLAGALPVAADVATQQAHVSAAASFPVLHRCPTHE